MLNEQLACMTPFSHIDQPGLSWRTREHGEKIKIRIRKILEIFILDFGMKFGFLTFDS